MSDERAEKSMERRFDMAAWSAATGRGGGLSGITGAVDYAVGGKMVCVVGGA